MESPYSKKHSNMIPDWRDGCKLSPGNVLRIRIPAASGAAAEEMATEFRFPATESRADLHRPCPLRREAVGDDKSIEPA